MVRLVDLDWEGLETLAADVQAGKGQQSSSTIQPDDDRPDPNFSLACSRALSCYPITSRLATHLDLNSLHDLSRTCRQFRVHLLAQRPLLIASSLRCANENTDPAQRLGSALNASFAQWTAYARTGETVGRIAGGKVGACARDMVGDCRRCGGCVCRNCIIKSPSATAIKGRHRRLCRTCMKSPIDLLTVVPSGIRANDPPSNEAGEDGAEPTLYSRDPCTCTDLVWLCQPCGQTLRNADIAYLRGWAWRTRYSSCGGIGAGLGEGNEGVQCGRGGACLAAQRVEKEIECEADELPALEAEMRRAMNWSTTRVTTTNTTMTKNESERQWVGSSYTTHEIVGIGGKVKKKLIQTLPVGATVKEYENERTTGKFLQREQEGANRSWCSWCERVVPGKKDLEKIGASSESVASECSGVSL